MTSIRKQILVGSQPHYVEVNSSLDLEEVEVTGTDPISGKTVHISLSSLLKSPRYSESASYAPQSLPSPSSLGQSGPMPSLLNVSAQSSESSSSSPAPMDMFSEPLPTITPPLSNEVTIQPAPSTETGLMGLAGVGSSALPAVQTPAQEVIESREPQGLEALEDPLPSMMENSSDDVSVEAPVRHLTPSLRRSEKEVLDEHLDSMYKPK